MKKFTKHEILELYGQVTLGEISFSEMVEIMNEMVEEPKFKEGDFLHSDWDDEDVTIIFKNQEGDKIYYHASKSCCFGVAVNDSCYWRDEGDFCHATEEEKQELLDALAKEGKKWNEEKKCVEDIPEKPKKGDLAIFWLFDKTQAVVRLFDNEQCDVSKAPLYVDNTGYWWSNAIKFESKEQYERFIKGEI